jgi:formylglycine-generating enzyme required for sulfatase activity
MPKLQRRILALSVALLGLGLVAVLGFRERAGPARCGPGFVALGARCCPDGQRLAEGACTGPARACPRGLWPAGSEQSGCAAVPTRVSLAGGSAAIGPVDWEADGRGALRSVRVTHFQLDGAEVDHMRWTVCADAGRCRHLPAREPGLPVSGVSAAEAETFCRFAGGRLPSSDEWLFAAAGTEARRFAWGHTGMVCRRAVYGVLDGPCATGGTGPDLPGSRPDGATPEGLWDMAGNVAEWTREPDGSAVARGGSYRSRLAAELKTWSFERPAGRSEHVGLRCAYSPVGFDSRSARH